MPQPLRSLCIALAALLLADLFFVAFDSLAPALSHPADRQFMRVLDLAVATITVVILASLVAFALRVRFSRGFLLAFSIANALVLASGSMLLDGLPEFDSLRDALRTALQWVEAGVSLALAFSLRTASARHWFAGGGR